MLRPLRSIFYSILCRMEATQAVLPIFRAISALALSVCLNSCCVAAIIMSARGIPLNRLALTRMEAVPLFLAYFLVLCRVVERSWISHGRLAQLREEFSNLPVVQKRRHALLFWSYVVLSVLSPPLVGLGLHALS